MFICKGLEHVTFIMKRNKPADHRVLTRPATLARLNRRLIIILILILTFKYPNSKGCAGESRGLQINRLCRVLALFKVLFICLYGILQNT